MSDDHALDPGVVPWRVGGSPATGGRTIYARFRPEALPREDEVLIGMMDTGELAARVVANHNAALDRLHKLTWCDRHPWKAWWRQVLRRPLGREAS